jgi:hypothetical protein
MIWKTLIAISTFWLAPLEDLDHGADGVIVLEGKYHYSNIYILNEIANEGVGYCTYEVRVNGEVVTDEVNSRTYEIDLRHFRLKEGDDVTIIIKHKNGCAPKVINPGGLKPKPTFETVDIKVSKEGLLEWTTKNEMGSLPFHVQQYKWNKWVDVGEVNGKGTPEKNFYAFKVDMTSGNNKYRVMQRNYEGKIKQSTSVEINSSKPALTYVYNKKNQEVVFSGETGFEIYDKYGRIVSRGYSSSVNLSHLSNDEYYLCFDNLVERFNKK